jgi:hypothetical protein
MPYVHRSKNPVLLKQASSLIVVGADSSIFSGVHLWRWEKTRQKKGSQNMTHPFLSHTNTGFAAYMLSASRFLFVHSLCA